jgi:hypothetical protein
MDRPLETLPSPIIDPEPLPTLFTKASKFLNGLLGTSPAPKPTEKTPASSSSSPILRPFLLSHLASDRSPSPPSFLHQTEPLKFSPEQRARPQGPELRVRRSHSPNYYAPATSSPRRSPPFLSPPSTYHSSLQPTGVGLGLGLLPMIQPNADSPAYSLAEGGFLGSMRRLLCYTGDTEAEQVVDGWCVDGGAVGGR